MFGAVVVRWLYCTESWFVDAFPFFVFPQAGSKYEGMQREAKMYRIDGTIEAETITIREKVQRFSR